MGDLHPVSSLRAQKTSYSWRWREYKNMEEWRTPGKQGPLQQLSKVHMTSQRLDQQKLSLHRYSPGPLHIYSSFQLSVFMGFLSMWTNGFLFLVPCLVLSFLCWVTSLALIWWFFLYLIIYLVMFGCWFLKACSFLMR